MTTADEHNSEHDPAEVEEEAGTSSANPASGEQCIYCPTGSFEPGTTTITLEREGTTLVVKQVPADVCWACGEALLDEETVDALQDMMERTVDAGIETAVRSYAKDDESPAEEAPSEEQKEQLLSKE
jgi:YgiT-type zinc finger domain-containing protein